MTVNSICIKFMSIKNIFITRALKFSESLWNYPDNFHNCKLMRFSVLDIPQIQVG